MVTSDGETVKQKRPAKGDGQFSARPALVKPRTAVKPRRRDQRGAWEIQVRARGSRAGGQTFDRTVKMPLPAITCQV
ncbi:hypothetical protein GY21_08495 [Cryobacterium roopkundense]|uniref:Uncharacterized protein n=1 Tax=Cryobacterium roopkundense TaxID=1001240 RepID=A0A099JHA5_9MICO|nr:hypothetical protein GY21_08495 [Cryobacterium roopkundense]